MIVYRRVIRTMLESHCYMASDGSIRCDGGAIVFMSGRLMVKFGIAELLPTGKVIASALTEHQFRATTWTMIRSRADLEKSKPEWLNVYDQHHV